MKLRQYPFFIITISVIIVIALYFAKQAFTVPDNFPTGKNFVINENESLKSISTRLGEDGYITSPMLFRMTVSFLHQDTNIQLGGYTFETPKTFFGVLHKLLQGKPDVPLHSATIPEGSTNDEVFAILAKELPTLSREKFNESEKTRNAYGKLFPSTYFLLPSYDEDDIVKLMLATYESKVAPVLSSFTYNQLLRNENDVLSLAAILEGEAKTKEDMEMVAGILLARLKMGMALQVDVAMETYKTKGLPAVPINNPGLIAINAALYPTASPYLYYITGNDGKMYYAKTFEEHKRNIAKYLR